MTKFMFDTNCFYQITENELNIINSDENEYFVTSIQNRELIEAKKVTQAQKNRLLNLFVRIDQEKKDLVTGLLGHKEAGQFPFILGSVGKYDEFKNDLDNLRKDSNNIEDALIAETAIVNGITLITSDKNLLKVVSEYYPEFIMSLEDYKRKYLWRFDKLGNYVELIKGISYRSEDYCDENEGYIFINLKCVERRGGFRRDGIKFYNGKVKNNQFIKKGDILIANTDITQNREVIGSPIRIPDINTKNGICFSLDLSKLEIISDEIYSSFLYYYLLSPNARNFMISNSNGTTVMHLSTKNVPNTIIPIPPLSEQKAIAKVLSNLDDKIELNNEMNKTLEEISQALFKRWFIDFEFPDENGNPYRLSGGEVVFSEELGKEIPKGWDVKKLDQITINYDSKRIPLSSRERNKKKGKYPYYGATGIIDYVDEYLFDGIYLLMAEDGSVINLDGHPILQYVWGRFWVNNHAHVLRGKDMSTEFIYLALYNTNVKHLVTGAVQPKINQNNMNNLLFTIPDNNTLLKFDSYLKNIFSLYQNNKEQNNYLIQLRDSLLPKLMSGEIRVPLEASQ